MNDIRSRSGFKSFKIGSRLVAPVAPVETSIPTPIQRQKVISAKLEWPLILRPLKLLACDGDSGLGDIVTHVIGDAESEAFQSWFESIFKKPCGCKDRRNWLNQRFPLTK